MVDLVIDFSSTHEKQKLLDILRGLEKCKQVIKIKKYRKARSGNQNRYYRIVLNYVSNFTGFSPDEAAVEMRLMFLPYEKVLKNGKVVTLGQSTKDLDTLEMEDYLEKIRVWALTEWMVRIPLPNETIDF